MMLSVLIVNYNVRYFLEYCLISVLASARHMQLINPGWQTEVLVIDNCSTDGSLDVLSGAFPSVTFIDAGENLGFGKANNRLTGLAKGKYLLFLNPDTLLPEPCLVEHVKFMESRGDIGASGIRMIDGSGHFLPESKRGFPGGWNSFCKMIGLTAVFPRSRFFAGYYQGHLAEDASAVVPVLSGAYMLVRSVVLQKTGGFDERFFMYAEDIDLSYRINLSGVKTFYFADLIIVHFKGESTRKDAAYVATFYTAMIQFVQKHFSHGGKLYVAFLKLLIKIKTKASVSKKADKSEHSGSTRTFTLAGDAVQVNKFRLRFNGKYLCDLEAPSRRYYPDDGNAIRESNILSELLICLGPDYTFSDLIETMSITKVAGVKILHPDATAIIGSDSKNTMGTVIKLHSCP